LVWVSDHLITESPDYPINRSLDLWQVLLFRSPDVPDHPILSTPPALFSAALKTNHFRQSTLGWRLRGPWVTQAWPLGGPSATQTQAQSVPQRVARHPCTYPMSTQF